MSHRASLWPVRSFRSFHPSSRKTCTSSRHRYAIPPPSLSPVCLFSLCSILTSVCVCLCVCRRTVQELEHVFESTVFTEKRLIEQLRAAVRLLKDAGMLETANMVYKLLIPIYEEHRDYEKLAECHKDLMELYQSVHAYVRHTFCPSSSIHNRLLSGL